MILFSEVLCWIIHWGTGFETDALVAELDTAGKECSTISMGSTLAEHRNAERQKLMHDSQYDITVHEDDVLQAMFQPLQKFKDFYFGEHWGLCTH
jgi:hypothetical protein